MLSLLLASALSALSTVSLAQNDDAVILNGRVMDPETGFDQVANVGISNGWITTITADEIAGAETIDATNHVVAPGFIDLEQHGIDPRASRSTCATGSRPIWTSSLARSTLMNGTPNAQAPHRPISAQWSVKSMRACAYMTSWRGKARMYLCHGPSRSIAHNLPKTGLRVGP